MPILKFRKPQGVSIHAVTIYKGHVIRDTFLRLVKFMRKIRDRLVLGIIFKAILVPFTRKLLEN